MKTIAKLKVTLTKTGMLLAGLFIFLNSVNAQQVINRGAEDQYLRIDLMDYSYFERMVMVSEFHSLTDAKVVFSEETGIVYIYPLVNSFNRIRVSWAMPARWIRNLTRTHRQP